MIRHQFESFHNHKEYHQRQDTKNCLHTYFAFSQNKIESII